jgi:DNA-binding HxlR family transcriptional regulator
MIVDDLRRDPADASSRPSSTPAAVMQLLTSKWAGRLLELLDLRGFARFGELQDALPGLGAKALTLSLRRLEAARLVERTAYAEVPPRVEYALTDIGQEAADRLREMREWIEENVVATTPAPGRAGDSFVDET